MAMTEAGRRLLKSMGQQEMFEELYRRDPTAARGLEPWDGRSPRVLTDAHNRFKLGNEGASLNEFDAIIDEQCRRHFHGF